MESRNSLVEQHFHLVAKVANAVSRKNPYAQLSDLLSSGAEGLFKASQTFKEEMGVPFEAYARLKIYGAMIDDLRKLDWVPRTQRDKQKGLEAYQKETLTPTSLDLLIVDRIPDNRSRIEESYESKELMTELVAALSKLPKKEYQVIVLYYYEELKMNEVARVLDISESYVSRLISSAVSKLKGFLTSQKDERRLKA